MALTLDLDFTAEAKNGDIFLGTITDATVYGTGGNPARADGALYITGEKMNADGTVEDDISFVTYSPTGVDAWTTVTFDIEKDGWHKFKIVFIRDFEGTITDYAQYEAVYSGGVVYRATQAMTAPAPAPPNASYWEVVPDPTSLMDNDGTATESPNLEFQLLQRVIYPNAKVLFGNKAEDAAIEGYGDSTRGEDVLTYEFVRLCVEAMNSLDQRGKQADGERVARKVEEFANS